MTGLTPIVSLSMLCGALVTFNIASLVHAVELRYVAAEQTRRTAVAEANLKQAERKWMACHESGLYTVGTDIYLSKVKKSRLTTKEVPEATPL